MPGLLRLPLELRNQIYHYLIPMKRIIEVSNPRIKYTISNKGTIGADITGLDIEEDISVPKYFQKLKCRMIICLYAKWRIMTPNLVC